MATISSEIYEYVGISNTTITNGVDFLLEVYVPDFLPIESGDPDIKTIYESKLLDPTSDVVTTSRINTSKTIICTYLGSGNGNQLVPCVHKGERVRVFNYGGSEQYYWQAYGRDPSLRLHERCRWFAMNQPKSVSGGSYPDVMDTNTYFMEINTNNGEKEIQIHTSINDGEPFQYDIRIMPERSILEITDNGGEGNGDAGNCIRLNSQEHWWHLRNVDDSTIDVNKENITLKCKDTITFDAGKHMVIKVGETSTTTVGKTMSTTVGNSITTKSTDITTTGDASITNSAPKVTTSASDTLTASGGSTANITGGSGDCVINGISLVHHLHPVPPHCPSVGITTPPI